jgi:hypothetical protein
MSFEKYLRSLMPQEYVRTSTGSEGVELNADEAVLSTQGSSKNKGFDVELESSPVTISRVLKLTPQKLLKTHGSLSFQYTGNGVSFKSVSLSELAEGRLQETLKVACSALVLKSTGEGYETNEENLTRSLGDYVPITYKKHFLLPSSQAIEVSETQEKEGKWTIKSNLGGTNKSDERPVIACGGLYEKGLNLNQCVPLYITLAGGEGKKTTVIAKSQLFWQERGVQGDKASVLDGMGYRLLHKTEESSLGEDIRNGKITFQRSGGDPYISFQYQTVSVEEQTVLVHFKLQF